MTVESQYKPVRYEGNGTAVTFPFAWLCLDAAWVRATVTVQDVETELTPAQDFTVSLLADSPGGSITLPAPLPQGKKITVWMSVPITQEHAYQNAGQLNVVTLEHAHDKHTLINQQLRADVDRSIKVPISSDNPPEILAELIFEARDQAYASAADAAASETNAAASAETAAALLEEITTEHGTALGDIGAAKADALSSMTQLRESTLSDVTREGQIQVGNVQQAASNVTLITTQAITDILDTGAQQEQRLRSVGDEQALNVILEGNAQEARVHASAAQATVEIAAQVQVASAEADRAKREADRAQDISNIGPASKTQRGWMIVGNGLRVDPDGKVHADIPSFLSLPVAGFPADVAIGYPATLSLSSETSIAGATVNRFMVVFDGAPAVEVQADTPGHATWTVTPTGTVHDQVGNIIVTAYDSNGNASNDATITFTKKIVEVAAPLVLSPVSGAVDVALLPVLTLQAGATTGMPSTNEKTQVQIARDAAFADMVWDSGEIAYATSVTVTSLLPDDAPLHSRARHKVSTYGWSAWGRASGFTTIKKAVLKPRILAPAQGAVNQSLSSTITLSALQTTGLAPAGRYTQVQLARDAAFADVVWDSGDASAYGVSKATSNLPVNTLLYCRGRHSDSNLGWSAWTDAVSFTTLNAYTDQPTVLSPAHNAVDVARRPAVQVSAISNIGPVDYGVETQIHVATDAGFANIVQQHSGGYVTQWTPPADLGIFALYFVRVRHRGAAWGWSPWSDVVTFKTLNVTLAISPVTQPVNGSTGVTLRPAFKWAVPVAVNQSFTEDSIMIATEATFASPVHYATATPSREYQVPEGILAINTLYYARPYARGSITGYVFGPSISFRTLNGWVNAPTITYPPAGTTVSGEAFYVASSPFSVAHAEDTHIATQFLVDWFDSSTGMAKALWVSPEITTGDLLTATTALVGFDENTLYNIKVRHKGKLLGWSPWSTAPNFVYITNMRIPVYFYTDPWGQKHSIGAISGIQQIHFRSTDFRPILKFGARVTWGSGGDIVPTTSRCLAYKEGDANGGPYGSSDLFFSYGKLGATWGTWSAVYVNGKYVIYNSSGGNGSGDFGVSSNGEYMDFFTKFLPFAATQEYYLTIKYANGRYYLRAKHQAAYSNPSFYRMYSSIDIKTMAFIAETQIPSGTTDFTNSIEQFHLAYWHNNAEWRFITSSGEVYRFTTLGGAGSAVKVGTASFTNIGSADPRPVNARVAKFKGNYYCTIYEQKDGQYVSYICRSSDMLTWTRVYTYTDTAYADFAHKEYTDVLYAVSGHAVVHTVDGTNFSLSFVSGSATSPVPLTF